MLNAAAARAADETQPAVWKAQAVTFEYQGFTTHYSCEGLRQKLRELLLALGARRDDLKLDDAICGGDSGVPKPFVSIDIRMATLQPAAEGAAKPVPAHWQKLDVGRAVRYERGDCELAEQVRQSLLPLFTTRAVESKDGGCTQRYSETGLPQLRLEALIAAPPPS